MEGVMKLKGEFLRKVLSDSYDSFDVSMSHRHIYIKQSMNVSHDSRARYVTHSLTA